MSKTKQRRRHEIVTHNLAPVNQAVKEYRVIEDGAYAYHLQNEEIENHYANNVRTRQTVMEDIRRAKELQDEEDRKARIMTLDEQREINEMDEELAEIVQEQIYINSAREEQERKEREERDKELALLMDEKDRRKAERAKQVLDQDKDLAAQFQQMDMNPSPPSSRDDQRMRLMTDEELAKRLQEEEKLMNERSQRRKQQLKSVVEMQDEELAKYIHERDIEIAEKKFSKEKERRAKMKKKGKYIDEPLYYDDNIDPRDRQAHHDRPPEYSPRDEMRYRDLANDPRNRHHTDHQQRHHPDMAPARPPPPRFPDSHRTEPKVPLDSSQVERRQAAAARESRINGGASPSGHDARRVHSEKGKKSKGAQHNGDVGPPNRSYSERPQHRSPHEERRWQDERLRNEARMRNPAPSRQDGERHHGDRHKRREEHPSTPTPKPRGKLTHAQSMPEPGEENDLDIEYSENFAQLTEEELQRYDNNNVKKKKSRKQSKSDCKQQ